jgi:hypothetical protein
MQSPLPLQMAVSTATNDHRFGQFQGFSTLLQLVHVATDGGASQSLSSVYLPLSDCTYGRPIQRFPKCGHHHDFAELHGQSMWQARCSRRNVPRREQRLHGAKEGLHDDMEYEQIYLNESLKADPSARRRNEQHRLILQASLPGD